MAKQAPKLNDSQKVLIAKFFEQASWNPENAEAQKKELIEKIQASEESLKSMKANLSTFDGREIRAQESLVQFDSMFTDAGEHERLSFLCNRFGIKPRAAKAPGTAGNTAKATDEEKETIMEVLDRDGQTVSEISKKCGLDTKVCARVLKAMIGDDTCYTVGERRGTKYLLKAESVEDEEIDETK